MPLVVPMRIETVTGVSFPLVAAVGEMSVDRLKQGLPQDLPATQAGTVGQTVTVVSQIGPGGATGAAGAPGANTGGISADFDGLVATDSATETVLKAALCAFGNLPSGMVTMAFTARGFTLGGATGTWKLRLGGTDGGVDGTVLATITVTSSSYATVSTSASFSNPNGNQVLKLTGMSSVLGLDTQLESVICTFVQG
jgi:hypothetical protein